MQNEISSATTTRSSVVQTRLQGPAKTLHPQPLDMLNLQPSTMARQLIPIFHQNEHSKRVQYSALND